MEVKIDSDRIRSERARRAWSQEHLAAVAGLGLRTVQRIEKTGTASQESVRSLASALSLEVIDLQPDADSIVQANSPQPLVIELRLTRDFPFRLVLLVAAGLIPVLYAKRQFELGIGWDMLFGFVLPAACVVCAVVWSYRKFRTRLGARTIAFVGTAAFSYIVADSFLFYTPPI